MNELMILTPTTAHTTPTNAAPTAPATAQRRLPVSPTSIALALVSPAVTTTMLALARHWSDHGARHSIGDMMPLTVGAIIGLAITSYAAATRDALLVGTCGSLTAAALGIGMMAYPAGLAEPLITVGVATVAGWLFTRRQWRARCIRRDAAAERQADRDHEQTVVGIQAQAAIEVEAIRQQGKTDRRTLKELGQTKRVELRLDAAEYEALKLERDTHRRRFMTVSPTATDALNAPTPNTTAVSSTARDALAPQTQREIGPAPAAPFNDADALAVALGLISSADPDPAGA